MVLGAHGMGVSPGLGPSPMGAAPNWDPCNGGYFSLTQRLLQFYDSFHLPTTLMWQHLLSPCTVTVPCKHPWVKRREGLSTLAVASPPNALIRP